MKIAIVTRKFPAFSETFMIRQMRGLLSRGHEIDVYAFKAGQESVRQESVKDLGLVERTRYLTGVPLGRRDRLVGAAKLLCRSVFCDHRLLRHAMNIRRYGLAASASRVFWLNSGPQNEVYDIIHCHAGYIGIPAVWWREAGMISGKIVTTFQGMDVNCYPARYKGNGYDLLFSKGDRFTANSEYTASNAAVLGCPRENIDVLPLGIDVDDYEFSEKTLSSDGPIRLLTVGRLTENKGLEYSIRAFAEVSQGRTDMHYVIAGDGPMRPALERLIQDLGLSDRVQLAGWKTERELRGLYSESHLCVVPSITSRYGHQEARGLVLQEAHACGMPIVSTRIGGIPENVLDGESGFLVPERDSIALAERIGYLVAHPEVWPEMGRAGREHMESLQVKYDPVERLVGIYQSLLDDED